MSVTQYNICGDYKAFGIHVDTHCQEKTKYGLCPNHCKYFYGVEIKESSIEGAGLGLWATKDFKREDFIVPYEGKFLTKTDLDKLTIPQREYTFTLTENCHIDGKYTNSSLGRFINDGKSNQLNNCRFSVNFKNKTVKMRAKRKIKRGTEIFVSYGNEYWPKE